ncbi:MAG: glycosyltransferase family 4 protein [Deltaproteobacteria bacterium]|nr:glycosyltransferase family 4 protein [Deltaproteobacteria bacterium]
MRVWLIQDGEPLPGVDSGSRDWRCGILANALVERGHEVLWWASTFDHAAKRHRFHEPRTIIVKPGLEIRLLHGPGYASNKSPKRFLHQRLLGSAFAREAVSRPKPDLIYCSLPTLEFIDRATRYGKSNRVKVLIDVRDLWPDLYLTMVPSFLKSMAKICLEPEYRRAKRALKLATGIIAVSESYFEWALQLAGRLRRSSDAVFPLGYKRPDEVREDSNTMSEKPFWGSDTQGGGFIVAFVGSFGASYDLSTVVKAAHIIHKEYASQNIQFFLVGSGDQDSYLRAMADGTPNIVFTGWLDHQKLLSLLRSSSVGLCAYRDNALQSLPNKPFEYMSQGLPILSSLRGELASLVNEERIGLQYQPGNVDSLVQQILWLATHPVERQGMGHRSQRIFEERFDAEVIYPQLVKHLEDIVATGKE